MIFGSPYGSPPVFYLVGWHTKAALLAEISGLAPYVVSWLMPMFCLALMPLGWSLLYRSFGFSSWSLVWAAFLLHACRNTPMGILHWGVIGLLIGLFLMPWRGFRWSAWVAMLAPLVQLTGPGLLQTPWPRETLQMETEGFEYIFVSDTHWEKPRHPFLTRTFDADERYQKILEGEKSALYKIDWSKEACQNTIIYGDGWGGLEHWGRWGYEKEVTLSIVPALGFKGITFRCARFDGQE